MRKQLLLILITSLIWTNLFSQTYTGTKAKNLVNGAKEVHINIATNQIDYVLFDAKNRISEKNLPEWIKRNYKLDDNIGLLEINQLTDKLSQTHIRYKLTVDNYPVHDAMIIAHIKDNMVFAINGIIQLSAQGNYSKAITETMALQYAVNKIGAQTYKWEIDSENKFIQNFTEGKVTSFKPIAEYEIIKNNNEYRLAYVFDIYAHNPMSRQDVYVDAQNGDILFINKTIHNADVIGSALTKYSGTQNIVTDSYNGTYRLRESGRGLGIETYDLNNATSYGGAVDFTDTDNYWNNVNTQQDEIATDAHWGMEMTYDYYFNKHNRNSIDGNGFKLVSYVHYSTNYANAFWNGQFMTFGDGNSTWDPLVALDIVGHEISHGLTSFTANLDYVDESGAMNEAFSDIFGTSIEFYAKPATANWDMGEDIGVPMRSMSDPQSKGDPDTYLGTNYYLGTADNGGVHTNSGVLNFIYYLMSDGDSGTNDHNDVYNVAGTGIDTAGAIAFRALTVYLTNTSQYADARYYFIKSAIDLYGPCSTPVETTTNAFYAAGIGAQYQAGVQADFDAETKNYCQPNATVNFINMSNNGMNYLWNFGDGNTSTDYNPTHDYTSFGNFVVTLITEGGSCGSDTIIKDNFISVDTINPCISYMPSSGTQLLTSCSGVLYDDGGSSNYSDNMNVITTIAPVGANSVVLTFTQFDFESGYDYLKIYDGPNTSSPLIGSYDGNTLPNGGTITANSGTITILEQTDVMVNESGFVASWQCTFTAVAPISEFEANDTSSCTGIVNFTNISQNGPTSFSWDFGDGNTSSAQNPSHSYTQNGIYTVSLTTTNAYGFNNITKSNYIKVNMPLSPIANSVAQCATGVVQLTASGNGLLKWYDSQTSNTVLDTGAVFTTPNLTQSTAYWVENSVEKLPQTGGMNAVANNGGILTYEQSLIFDVFKASSLKSVDVYVTSAGSRTIKLQNASGTTLESKTVTVASGWNTVELDFDLPIATNLMLTGTNMWRHNSNVSYPYNIPGILSITKSSASSNATSYYYYFYNWIVQENACISDRIEVNAFINSATPIVDFAITNNDPYVDFTNNTVNNGIAHWNYGDQATSNKQNPTHLYLNNGTYNVELTVDNGCGVLALTKTVTINLATSINEIEEDLISKIYPNPNNGIFSIEINADKKYKEMEIYNSIGLLVYNSTISIGKSIVEIDISNMSPGMYLINLKSSDTNTSLKFIKK
ncbi:MAG: M4 family metallopeptidase [Bacteroidales bacterium]|nr:M4 family metallopeptidase [Bacteroidales bacterium]